MKKPITHCDEKKEKVTDPNLPPMEPFKPILALLWMLSAFVATTISLVLTHERMPQSSPLPDILHQILPQYRWGTGLSDLMVVVGVLLAIMVVLLHNYRLVILTRVWLILGILYYYRAITMFITALPHPDNTFTCAPKMNNINVDDTITRVLKHLSGGGLTVSQHSVYCGDFIFSGHTMALVMAYLTIKQYAPKHLLLQWISFLVASIGVTAMLVGRGHYSIDVLIAYFVTTRVWWVYHALASHPSLQPNIWWFNMFAYFERNVPTEFPGLEHLIDANKVNSLRTLLDNFLSKVPDQPTVPGRAQTNSLLRQISMLD